MKRLILLLIILSLAACAHAQTTRDDELTTQELTALRKRISNMKRQMDLLMGDIISTSGVAGAAAGAGASLPGAVMPQSFGSDVYVDVVQNDKNVVVKADLPGMSKDKIDITLDNDRYLKISGSREIMKDERSPGVVRQERFSGKFSKIVELPCEVNPAGINATYKEGVLEITIPKKAPAKEESVKINVK